MKIEAELKIKTTKGAVNAGDSISLSVDEDYAIDFDDVIRDVENQLWNNYGVSMYFNTDFDITNQTEICEELFDNKENEICE